jgi:serine/threonine-protein kinase HipA
MLAVSANHIKVGSLHREHGADTPEHRFVYEAGTTPANAVSLLMSPVQVEHVMKGGRLHPVFDMNLPEGELREAIMRMFAKAVPRMEDYALLQVIGGSAIGRLRVGSVPPPVEGLNIKKVLRYQGTGTLFRDLMERYARNSGISGMQPKLLIRDDGGLTSDQFSSLSPAQRLTANETSHIIKAFDPVRFPGLAANEYLCLQAAKAGGIAIPGLHLADDAGVLVLDRFDLKVDGTYMGFEDACALLGHSSNEKYEDSYEILASKLFAVLRGNAKDMRQFFKSVTLSMMVRNGDAHLKNFGVLYDDPTKAIRLAPCYDVVTTVIYAPNEDPALTMEWRKRWPDKTTLLKYGIQCCRLDPNDAREAISEVAQGVSDTRGKFPDANMPAAVTQQMWDAWEEGLTQIAGSGYGNWNISRPEVSEEAVAKNRKATKPPLPGD